MKGDSFKPMIIYHTNITACIGSATHEVFKEQESFQIVNTTILRYNLIHFQPYRQSVKGESTQFVYITVTAGFGI